MLSQIEAQYVEAMRAHEILSEDSRLLPSGDHGWLCSCGQELPDHDGDAVAIERDWFGHLLAVLREYVPTTSCPTCEGAEEVPNDGPRAPVGRYGANRPCPECHGEGRTDSDVRYRLVRQVGWQDRFGIVEGEPSHAMAVIERMVGEMCDGKPYGGRWPVYAGESVGGLSGLTAGKGSDAGDRATPTHAAVPVPEPEGER